MKDTITRLAVRIEGIRPLLMHHGRLANPMDPYAIAVKEIAGKRKKTPADYEELARREFIGGMYYDEEACRPAIPAELLDAVIRKGATNKSKGADVQRGVEVEESLTPLEYEGPRGKDELWRREVEGRRVHVDQRMSCPPGSRGKVLRTRARFDPPWSLEFTVRIYPGASISTKDVHEALEHAGVFNGVGDYRPRFGLFRLAKFEELGAAKAA